MIFFISVLRALSTVLITNSHYENVYPTNLLSKGGIIGLIMFYVLSGYCLCNIKYPFSPYGFVKWYGKRVWRIYLPVVIITTIYFIIGAYNLSKHGLLWWFVYPTAFHYVASVMILYIPFFFIIKIQWLNERIVPVMGVIAVAWLVVYFSVYDKSYYHIDAVREPMIRFLGFEGLLLGAWFKKNDDKYRDKIKLKYPVVLFVVSLLYFAIRLALSKWAVLSSFQFISYILIFALVYFLFITFCGIASILDNLPDWIKAAIKFFADMTLEIYIVQRVIITFIMNKKFGFPLNWLLLTISIILVAYLLHKICFLINKMVDKNMSGHKNNEIEDDN